MDGIQTLLIIVIVTLTILLVIVGVQVMLVILGVRRILGKLEQKIDQSDLLTQESVKETVGSIKDFIRKKFTKK